MNKNFLNKNKTYLLVGILAVISTVLTMAGVLTRRTPVITPDLLTQISPFKFITL